MNVELINYTTSPIFTIANAARMCTNSQFKSQQDDLKLVADCIAMGHLSVTEFASFTFKITGMSRISSQQVTRHRLTSVAQKSQRYVEESNFDYVVPNTITNNNEAFEIYEECINSLRNAYSRLVELKIPKEDARFLLPNATKTDFFLSLNFRELMHFCNERLCSRAQWEIRELARLMKDQVIAVEPFLASYLVPKCTKLGQCPEKYTCGFSKPKNARVRR
jgi:thymidylate synthase (FAD)